MCRTNTTVVLAIAGAICALMAQTPAEPALSGKIRISGHGSRTGDYAGNLVRRWNEGFRRLHPAVQFDVALFGDSAAMGAD
jgi:ABC-type phosphate transport system substrate-binding protein